MVRRHVSNDDSGTSGEHEASYAPYVSDDFGNLYAFVRTLPRHTHNLSTPGARAYFLENTHA